MLKNIKLWFKKNKEESINDFMLQNTCPYSLIFYKNKKFNEYKKEKKEYLKKYTDESCQENDLFFVFNYGMCPESLINYIKSNKNLKYGVDYIGIGFMEGVFLKEKIKPESIFNKVKLVDNRDKTINFINNKKRA